MSKVISCFGCSFTGGVLADTEPRESWPYRLSLARPDLKVYNFGRQATSALFSLNMIDQVSEQLKSDLVITQLTEPTRMTFYDSGFKLNLKQDLLQISDNYWVLPMSIKGIWPFNGVSGKRQTRENFSSPSTAEKYQLLKNLMVMHEDQNHFDSTPTRSDEEYVLDFDLYEFARINHDLISSNIGRSLLYQNGKFELLIDEEKMLFLEMDLLLTQRFFRYLPEPKKEFVNE
jgi:hypothetical protein